MAQTGVVNIRGKEYQTVALRVQHFREHHPDWSLLTEIVSADVDCVRMRAWIADPTGRVMATGHAEEYRRASEINRTSALENCETSAIGRALAAMGLAGTEFASADEVARAVSGAKGEAKRPAMPESAIADHLAAIEAASDLDGLKKAVTAAKVAAGADEALVRRFHGLGMAKHNAMLVGA